MEYFINAMTAEDWEYVRSIYLEGIATGNATFESDAPNWEKWNSTHLPSPRLVARASDTILGWAALSPVSSRCVYSGVAEVSLYVSAKYRKQGVGASLLRAVIEESERVGIWTLQAGIFPENRSSLELTKRHGFREVGRRKKLGKMTYGTLSGTWRDVVLMERRSEVVGTH